MGQIKILYKSWLLKKAKRESLFFKFKSLQTQTGKTILKIAKKTQEFRHFLNYVWNTNFKVKIDIFEI